ncbi:DMT family transporter [Sulfitobacter sp. 1A12779]|uniref:DMT family transporter n=1 Tax=Sulfitobacter sp. 1A12779 TaxID=3368599 RepID=UPI003746ED7B
MQATRTFSHSGSGIFLMCAGIACIAINDAFAKVLTEGYAPVQILFLRNILALPFALVVVLLLRGKTAVSSRRPLAHLLRGAFWTCAATFYFTGLKYLDLAEATALTFSAPIFIISLSSLFLGEHVGWRRGAAVIIGFVGVLIVVRPGSAAFQPAALFPVGTALFYALLMIGSRWVDPRESVWTVMLWLVGAGALISALFAPFYWTPVQYEDLWRFGAITVFGTAGMTLITQAFRFSEASTVANFEYTGLIWATLLGWLIWREVPDLATFVGTAVIVFSGAFIVYREGQMKV